MIEEIIRKSYKKLEDEKSKYDWDYVIHVYCNFDNIHLILNNQISEIEYYKISIFDRCIYNGEKYYVKFKYGSFNFIIYHIHNSEDIKIKFSNHEIYL
jgi:hypothetical protein